MLRISLICIFFGIFFRVVASESGSIEHKLQQIEDISYVKISDGDSIFETYKIYFTQPVDHKYPNGKTFEQVIYLNHRNENAPMVLAAEGYNMMRNSIYEMTDLLSANQIQVEHRYFGESTPDTINYSYLNMFQVSSDLHKIKEFFSEIYSERWIGTGISKGGQTIIYYSYYYPEDLDARVSYVAPFNTSLEDERIYNFFDTIGTKDCRSKIKEFQLSMLKERKKILPLINWYTRGMGIEYTYMSLEEAFEYTILEYPFSFWQWGHSCSSIPSSKASLDEKLTHLLKVIDINFYSDFYINYYSSHYYQAASELGYYGYEIEEYKPYLKVLGKSGNPSAAFPPAYSNALYNNELSTNIYNWINTNGDHFIHIYGSSDTWTATAIPPNENLDALWIFISGTDHAKARIKNMSDDDFGRVTEKLENWLDLEIMNKQNDL